MPLLLEIEGLSTPMSEGGRGSVGDCTSHACGGGSMDEEVQDTCEGEVGGRGGRSMDGATTNKSGLGGVGRIIRACRLVNGAYGDACVSE